MRAVLKTEDVVDGALRCAMTSLRAAPIFQGVAFGECFVMAQRSAPSTTPTGCDARLPEVPLRTNHPSTA